MSQPILIAGSNQKWDALLGIVVGIGCLAGGAGFWREIAPMGPVLIALGALLVLGCSLLWLVRRVRRRWCLIGPDDFVLRDIRGEETYRDDDVFAMSLAAKKNYISGVYQSTTRVFTIWVEDGAGTRRIVMTTRLKGNDADPLAALVDRLAQALREEASRSLAAGHRVEGKGWALERDALVVSKKRDSESIPLSEITAADIFDRHVCVWRRGIDEPVARFRETGENAWVLLLLLQERAAKQRNGQPDGGLGRILFERRPLRIWAWIGYSLGIICFLSAGGFVLGAVVRQELELLIGSAVFGALSVLLLLGAFASRRRIFRCHEYGVHSVRWFRERRLRYTELAAFTFSATRVNVEGVYSGTHTVLTFEPGPEAESVGGIHYSATVYNADDAIDEFRDKVSRVIALRLARERAEGRPVPWLEHLVFESNGLRYRAAGFLRRKNPVLIPYGEITNYTVQDGTFKLWSDRAGKPLIKENSAQRNFFPGFMLLIMILSTPQTLQEEAAELQID